MKSPIDILKAARAVARIVADPTRLDEVFVLADLSEKSPQLHEMIATLEQDPEVAAIFAKKPRLGPVDQDALARLPEGTVGRAYADFMRARGLRHEDLTLVDSDEADMDWIRNHLRETHDLWHVVTGFDTDVAGELGLQAVYLAQFGAPLAVMLLGVGMANTLFFSMDDRERRMDEITRGWLLGKRAKTLFGVRWAESWEKPLAQVREELGLDLEALDDAIDRAVTSPVEARPARAA